MFTINFSMVKHIQLVQTKCNQKFASGTDSSNEFWLTVQKFTNKPRIWCDTSVGDFQRGD